MLENYELEDVIPKVILFNLSQMQNLGIIKEDMARKLIRNREIESIKIGNKHHVPRYELVRYLEPREDGQSLEDVIPNLILFSLKEIENYGIIKVDMLKKLIQNKELKATFVGTKVHIARHRLIYYLEKNTIKRIRRIEMSG